MRSEEKFFVEKQRVATMDEVKVIEQSLEAQRDVGFGFSSAAVNHGRRSI